MLSFEPKDLSTGRLHGYLLSAVAPRPIAFASTIDKAGNPNLAPFSYFNVFSSNPPILVFSPARRVRDNTTKHTLENVKEVAEVVINVVNYSIVQQMSLSSTEYPKAVNEFDKTGLTMLQSDVVRPYRVAQSPIQLECKVNDIVALGDQGGAGHLILCEVLKFHISEVVLDANGIIDQEKLDLIARAGGNYYSRAKLGFFEIAKPLTTLGIGVDALPEAIRTSNILTGNDLGMLANVEALPTDEEIKAFIAEERALGNAIGIGSKEKKHQMAQKYLSKGAVQSAWKLLLS